MNLDNIVVQGRLARIIVNGLREQRRENARVMLRELHAEFTDIHLEVLRRQGFRDSWRMQVGARRGSVRFRRWCYETGHCDSAADAIEKTWKRLIQEDTV